MNIIKERFFLISLLFLFSICLYGQQNPAATNLTVLENTQYQFDIQSSRNPIFIQPHPDLFDSLKITIVSPGIKNYRYHYTAGNPGAFQVMVEYYVNGSFPGWDPPKYTEVNIEIVNSILIPQQDYFSVHKNSAPIELDVLANDSTSHHPLTLYELVHQQNGNALIQGGDKILFTPETDFVGNAYLNYVASNDYGITGMGTVSISVIDTLNTPVRDTIRLSTRNTDPITILLPSSDFELSDNFLILGELIELEGNAKLYSPFAGAEGVDTFLLKTPDSSLERLVIMNVIALDEDNSFVRDDIVYTTLGTPVTFNVFENDLKSNYITSYSSELSQGSAGVFTYNTPLKFVGVKQFYYTAYNGLEYQTAQIYIHVNNFYPEDIAVYNLTTLQNNPLVIQYEVPIENYGFTVLSNPNNGTLTTQNGSGIINTDCQSIDGFNLLSYVPNLDFIGSDEFDLEYCIDGTNCEVVKVNVEVLAMDADCYCAGPECVWAGDADGNGIVSVADILPVGFHMGATGSLRGGNDPMAWYGQFSNEWGEEIYNGKNAKHADTNGDGMISSADTISVSSNYSFYHNLIPDKSLILKEYPVAILPRQTSFDSGDFVLIDIAIGDDQYPVVDVHGLAYSLQIAPGIIDSSSLVVDFRDDLWFGNNSPTIDLAKQPSDGQIEMAFTRTSGFSVSGSGIITTVGFIGDDDLDGFSLAQLQGQIPFEIKLSDIIMVDGQGNEFKLPDASSTLTLHYDLRETGPLTDDKVIVYPNPASDIVRLYVNGRDEFQEIMIFNQLGQQVTHLKSINSHELQLDISELPMGMYALHVKTTKGAVVKKLQVIKTD